MTRRIEALLRRAVLERKTVLRQKTVFERRASAFAVACGSALALLACGGVGDGAVEPGGVEPIEFGHLPQPIVGGETDRVHSAVLAIALVTRREEALCTGSLIAPNLVLTARHCVAVTDSETVDCGDSTFGRLHAPENLWVSSATTVGSGNFYPVREILVPEQGELCGSDIALMILDGQFRETSIAPIAPRLDQPARRGESFTAVGFGDALEDGEAGVRRALDGLEIVCGPDDCNAPNLLTQREFVGEQGVCDGDSGGPALDSSGRVVGVASRATEDCGLAVYSAVSPWRDWIVSVAEKAYEQGRYEIPAWLADEEGALAGTVSTPAGNSSSAPVSGRSDGIAGESLAPDLELRPASHSNAGCSIAAVGSGHTAPIGPRNPLSTAGLGVLALAGALALRRPRRVVRSS